MILNTKNIKIVGCFVLAIFLAGCAHKEPIYVTPAPKPSLKQVRNHIISKLTKNDVQVIRIGEEVRIVIRDDFVFMPDSANIREEYKPTLSLVAKLMRTYDKINVKVAGYQDNQGKARFLQALSTEQAQTIAKFLWRHGVDTRLLYSVGYSNANPVSWNGDAEDRSYNRRVEISFRYYPESDI